METSRYGFSGFCVAYACMDALYEICDAEFNSERRIYAEFNRLRGRHVKYDGLLAVYLVPLVTEIAERDNIMQGLNYSKAAIKCVAIKCAADFIANHDGG